MDTPKISIIVPVYKVEKYLHRCLDSIVKQTFTDWECILVDDGSPDNSGNICDEYAEKDKRFRVLHNENAGVSTARNNGLDEAKGEYVTFVDSDDWIKKEMLEELYNAAIDRKAEMVVSGLILTDGNNFEREFKARNGWLNIPKDFYPCIQGSCSKLFLKTVLSQYKIKFPVGITIAEDLYFVFQVCINSKRIFGTDKLFYYYRINSNSVTHNISIKNIQDHAFIINRIISTLKDTNNESKDWEEWILIKKHNVKNQCIRNCNFALWWQVFPEINYNFQKLGLKQKIFKLLVIMKLYCICRLIIRYKTRSY